MNVIIVGSGKVGRYLANLLHSGGHSVKVIEMLPEQEKDLPPNVFILGNGTDPAVLEAAGINQANVIAAVTGGDETNLVIATLARFEFNTPRIIARVNNPKNAWMFTPEMGVDVALNQADLMARLIAEEMSMGDMMTILKLRRGQFSLVEEKVDPTSEVINKKLSDIKLPKDSVVVAILRGSELQIPHGDTVLMPADEVLALVHSSELAEMEAMLGPRKN